MAVTAFGKHLRTIRIQEDLLLGHMARKLGISSAQLSAMELGNRTINPEIAGKIASNYNQNEDEILNLIEMSQPSVKTNMKEATVEQRKTMNMFRRAFTELSDERLKKIQELIEDVE